MLDTQYTNELVCPYCGHEFSDSWEREDRGEFECYECDKNFSFDTDVTRLYSSERDCQLNGQEHEWEDTRELSRGTWQKCKNCDQTNFLRHKE